MSHVKNAHYKEFAKGEIKLRRKVDFGEIINRP